MISIDNGHVHIQGNAMEILNETTILLSDVYRKVMVKHMGEEIAGDLLNNLVGLAKIINPEDEEETVNRLRVMEGILKMQMGIEDDFE